MLGLCVLHVVERQLEIEANTVAQSTSTRPINTHPFFSNWRLVKWVKWLENQRAISQAWFINSPLEKSKPIVPKNAIKLLMSDSFTTHRYAVAQGRNNHELF